MRDGLGARILLALRKYKQLSPDYLRAMGRPTTNYGSDVSELAGPDWMPPIVHDMERLALIARREDGTYELGATWGPIQDALGVSLTEMAKLGPDAFVISPEHGRPEPIAETDIFVLMPFTQDMRPIYENHIKKVAYEMTIDIHRADDFFNANMIMSDIWNQICGCRALIADCTGRNPNVFYELGLAHAVGKPVILITQNPADIPFDLSHIRHIRYEYTPDGMPRFEGALRSTLEVVLRKNPRPAPVETTAVPRPNLDDIESSRG